MKKKKLLLLIPLILIPLGIWTLLSSISAGEIVKVDAFKDTPAWSLAKAVKAENVKAIERIAKENPEALNYQAGEFGITPLIWAIGTERYEAAEALLKAGADPDLSTTFDGATPLFVAAGSTWKRHWTWEEYYEGPKFINLLLKYGADPNKAITGKESDDPNVSGSINQPGKTPLMESIGDGIEKTKALVEGGADIDMKTKYGQTAATHALREGGGADCFGTLEEVGYARYLIAHKKAKVTEPYYSRFKDVDPNLKFWPVGDLQDWVFDLDSPEYKVKKEIIAEFERQGVDYRGAEIHPVTLEYIKETYPDSWQEYITKY